jgi:hypothetical protein
MNVPSIGLNSRFLLTAPLKSGLEQMGPGAHMIFTLAIGVASLVVMMFLIWLFLRPYRQRRRKLVAKVPKTKTGYTARYQFRGESRCCTMSLVFRHEQDTGWIVTGTSIGDKCKFVRGRVSTFGNVELELGEGGMFITGVFDPESGAISGTWKTKKSSKKSYGIVLEPESQARPPLPTHATIV